MIRTSVAVCCIFLAPSAVGQAAPPIALDGCFNDWTDIATTLVDPLDAPKVAVDFHTIKITHDHEYVYFKVDVGSELTIQGLPGRMKLLLDVDGDASTGEMLHGLDGVDLIIDLTQESTRRPGEPGWGVGLRSTTFAPESDDHHLSPYDVGFVMAPTYASRLYEMRIERHVSLPQTPTTFDGNHFRGKFVFRNWDGVVAEQTDVFRYTLTTTSPTVISQPTDPLARAADSDFRVISWNAERGSMVPNPDPFARVLRALDPDAILWQELTNQNNAEQIEQFLNAHLGGTDEQPWTVIFGRGGGPLRTAVASRHPITAVHALDLLPYPTQLDRQIRVSGAIIDIKGKKLLAASVHLKCCGRLDSREDNQRREEVRCINKAMHQVVATHDVNGVLVGGDLNLVGAREPKLILSRALDVDGGDLAPVDAYQLSGRKNATWSERGSAFTPGRLDFLLYGRAAIEPAGSFVFSAPDLLPRWLQHHGILLSDTIEASDHYPVVADFRWTKRR